MTEASLGIYIHIPFCLAKCQYCAFVSQAGAAEFYQSYIAALCSEIAAEGGGFAMGGGVTVDSVFVGGGTPTVLCATDLAKILHAVNRQFHLAGNAEISLEANPGTVDRGKLTDLRVAGFNRLSLGVQSFDDDVLAAAGRIHCAAEAAAATDWARQAGFDNLSLDLMYGLPRQSFASFHSSLAQAIRIGPDHISAYGLKLEAGTPLAEAVQAATAFLPAEEEEEAMYDLLNDELPRNGYQRYEISNFSLPGRRCRHNLKYWRFLPYRGFGVAAHSFLQHERFANTEDLGQYLERTGRQDSPEIFREHSAPPVLMAEYIFLALRTLDGLDAAEFSRIFAADFWRRFQPQLVRLTQMGLVRQQGERLVLTPRGMKLGNQVFAEFLP